MADIDATTEARRKAQRKGEEDPVVAAQRYLNIFRQMHVFPEERKTAFNQMLLELPPDIRGLFRMLPGGALLQDYVDDLAEKAGLERSTPTVDTVAAPLEDEEVSKAKILATALAEAQMQASAQMQVAPMAAPVAAVAPVVNSTVAMDKDFAATFATTIADALQKNNASQKEELRSVLESIGENQMQIIKAMQDESSQQYKEMQNLYSAIKNIDVRSAPEYVPPHAPTPAPTQNNESSQDNEQIQILLKVLTSGQQMLAQRLNDIEAKGIPTTAATSPTPSTTDKGFMQLSKAIMASQENFGKTISILGERQKKESIAIAKLINESQQKMMRFIVQHNTLNQNSGNASANNNIQINSVDYTAQLNQIAEKLANIQIKVDIPQTAVAANAAAPAVAAPVVVADAANPITVAAPTINFDSDKIGSMLREVMTAQSDMYREMAKSQTEELRSVIAAALQESQKVSTQSLIEALSKQPLNLQVPVNTNTYTRQPLRGRGPVSEQNFDDLIDFSEPTPTFNRPLNEQLPNIMQEYEEREAIADTDDSSYDNEETSPANEVAEIFELAEDRTSFEESEDIADAPKRKKKKKKKKKSAETDSESLEIILGSELQGDDFAPTVLSSDNFSLDDSKFEEETEVVEYDTAVEEYAEPESIAEAEPDIESELEPEPAPESEQESTAKKVARIMMPSAPSMPDIADDLPELDDWKDDTPYDLDDPNIGTNWRGNDEDEEQENMQTFDTEPITEIESSADDWGFGSSDETIVEEGEEITSELIETSEENTDTDVETVTESEDFDDEEWVWEYVEEESTQSDENYGYDNDEPHLIPILQTSVIGSGELFYQGQSFGGVSISSESPQLTSAYQLVIADSAQVESADDPYKRVL